MKLKASTLIETIVAMVIIMICTGIGLSLFSNLSHNVNDELRIEAELRISSLAAESKQKNDFTEITIELSDMRLERSISNYQNIERLKVLLIEAYTTNGRKICGHREIVEIN
jgi:competence protein ComGF